VPAAIRRLGSGLNNCSQCAIADLQRRAGLVHGRLHGDVCVIDRLDAGQHGAPGAADFHLADAAGPSGFNHVVRLHRQAVAHQLHAGVERVGRDGIGEVAVLAVIEEDLVPGLHRGGG
jgi:hypothetical protein